MKTHSEQTTSTTDSARSLSSAPQNTPALPPILATVAIISLLLTAIVGGLLFFFPNAIQARWVWALKPYNTRFLGAIYLAAAVGFTHLLVGRRSSIARLIVPMLFVFTTNALVVSCLQLQQFTVGRRATDLWFFLYIVDCVCGAYYLGYYRQRAFAGVRRLARPWAVALGVQAGLLGVYGLSLLFFPATTGGGWLWPLDVFHSQLYSSLLLAGAVGSAVVARRASAGELRTFGSIQLTFSALVLIGVGLVDTEMQLVDWSRWVNWAWMGAIALLGIVGIGLLRLSRVRQSAKAL